MIIAVTTPTGHIGKVVTENLFSANQQVRLLCRHPDKVQRFIEDGADVREGSLDDTNFVVEATRDVDALFWVTPPCYEATDLRALQNRMGRAAAKAIATNRIPHVVNLSSIGADIGSGTGPINGLHDVEKILDEVASHITHLRPGFFYENYLWQSDLIRTKNSVFLPVNGSVRYPMLATRDIAQVATLRLIDMTWIGRSVCELHGPAELSFDEAAAAISEGLDRKVTHVKVPEEEAGKAMREHGMSEDAVKLMLELYRAIDCGWLRSSQPRSAETTTPTTLAEFAREVLRPLVVERVVY